MTNQIWGLIAISFLLGLNVDVIIQRIVARNWGIHNWLNVGAVIASIITVFTLVERIANAS